MNNEFEIISQSRAPSTIVLAEYNRHTHEYITVGPGYFTVSVACNPVGGWGVTKVITLKYRVTSLFLILFTLRLLILS